MLCRARPGVRQRNWIVHVQRPRLHTGTHSFTKGTKLNCDCGMHALTCTRDCRMSCTRLFYPPNVDGRASRAAFDPFFLELTYVDIEHVRTQECRWATPDFVPTLRLEPQPSLSGVHVHMCFECKIPRKKRTHTRARAHTHAYTRA